MKVLKKFEDVILVPGHRRSLIMDLGREEFKFIPNYLIEFLNNSAYKTQAEISNCYSSEDQELIKSYLEFLLDAEYIYFIEREFADRFIPIETTFLYPAKITNCILEFKDDSFYDIFDVFNQTIELGCRAFQIRERGTLNKTFIKGLMEFLKDKPVQYIEFYAQFPGYEMINIVQEILVQNPIISSIILFNSPVKSIESIFSRDERQLILTPEQSIDYEKFNENNHPAYFNCNINLYSESINHNTYYHKKVCVDYVGNIKNCLSLNRIFGNVKDNPIEEIVNMKEFTFLWEIKKEEIDVCRDCEFRFVCVDSRPIFRRDNGSFYHEKECNYNPYIAKWKWEKGYKSLESCGIKVCDKGFEIFQKLTN